MTTHTATPTSHSAITDCRRAFDPTDQDVKYALGFAGSLLDPEDWYRRYTVESMRVNVTWFRKDKREVVFLDYLIYSCGFKETDWDYVLSDQIFRDVRFGSYRNLNRVASCSSDNVRLLEYTYQDSGKDYRIRFWASLNGPTRLVTLSLDFPDGLKTELDRYSSQMFPALPSCP